MNILKLHISMYKNKNQRDRRVRLRKKITFTGNVLEEKINQRRNNNKSPNRLSALAIHTQSGTILCSQRKDNKRENNTLKLVKCYRRIVGQSSLTY